jgi:predicted HicB family RNase H-like nuclease
VPDFPRPGWLASSPKVALRGIRKVVAEVVADFEADGELVPEPIATERHSGKFLVRVPPELNRRITLDASKTGVSLNCIASEKLGR